MAAFEFLAIRCVMIGISDSLHASYGATTQNVESSAFLVVTFLALRNALPATALLASLLPLVVVVLQKDLNNSTNYARAAVGHVVALIVTIASAASSDEPIRHATTCLTFADVATRVACAAVLAAPLDATDDKSRLARNVSAFMASLISFFVIALVDIFSTLSFRTSVHNTVAYVSMVTTLLVSPLPLRHPSSLDLLVMQFSIIFLTELLTSLCQTPLPALVAASLAVLVEKGWRASNRKNAEII